MCGLFGVAGPAINGQDLKIFKELGVVSQLRGTDGAGVYQVKTNTTAKHNYEMVYKTCNTFNDLLYDTDQDKRYISLMNNVQVDLIMGHVRAATRGYISTANAHPFVFNDLVGMHNGTLRDFAYQHKSKTDSEMMFQDIHDHGVVDVLSTLHKDSAFAITMYERKNKSVVIAKNSKRPLAFAILKTRNVLYWASEKEMLRFVLRRHGLEYTTFELHDDVIYRLYPARINAEKTGLMFTKVAHLPTEVKPTYPQLVAPPIETVIRDAAKELENKVEDKEPKKEVQTAKILPMLPRGPLAKKDNPEKGDTRQYHLSCDCGKDSLNLFEAYMCKQGAEGYPKYNPQTNTFECQVC